MCALSDEFDSGLCGNEMVQQSTVALAQHRLDDCISEADIHDVVEAQQGLLYYA